MYGIEKRSNPPGFTTSNCIYNSAHTVWTIYSLPFFPPTKLNFNVGCSQFLFHSFCHIVFCFQDKFDIPIVLRLIASVLDDNVLVDVLRVEKKKNDFKSLLNLISFVMAVGVTHIIHLSSSWLVIFFFYCVCCFCCFGHVVDSVIGHCHTLASANPSITIDMISWPDGIVFPSFGKTISACVVVSFLGEGERRWPIMGRTKAKKDGWTS